MTEHDVVVVGAGLAGLRAAAVLARRGLDVAVLEAADRPGGRIATDVVDGFRLDRGFQVLNTVYPALRAPSTSTPLHLCPFVPGVAIRRGDGALHTSATRCAAPPWPGHRHRRAVRAARQGSARRVDRAGGGHPAAAHGDPDRPERRPRLRRARLDGPVVDQFLRPFLSGVLGERELVTSAAYVRLVWRCFARGSIAVPADGMGALPALLADALPERPCRPGGGSPGSGPAASRSTGRRCARGRSSSPPTRAPRVSCSPAWKSRSCAR